MLEIKPFIKWQGGKTRTKDIITSHFKPYNTYVELFIGGGSIFFKEQPKNAYISDINTNLMNIYMIIRDYKEKIMILMDIYIKEYIPMNNEERKIYFYNKRTKYNNIKFYKDTIIEKQNIDIRILCASLFIFLNKTCFNGLYRENMKQKYNVSMGKYKNPTIYIKENIINISKYLKNKNIHILYGDYSKIYKEIYKKLSINETIIYLDPPYYPIKENSFTFYCGSKFNHDDNITLHNFFNILPFKVYMSNSNCDFINKTYNKYKIIMINTIRSGGGLKKGSLKCKDCLIIK